MSDNIQTNATGRLTPCLQQKIDKTRYLVEIHFSIIEQYGLTEWDKRESGNKTDKSVDEIAREVIRGDWGNGTDRKNRLVSAEYDYDMVQSRVNALLGADDMPAKKSVDEIAREVIRGDWGNGSDRKTDLHLPDMIIRLSRRE